MQYYDSNSVERYTHEILRSSDILLKTNTMCNV